MKESKSTTKSSTIRKSSKPFFSKNNDRGFFSNSKETNEPFFKKFESNSLVNLPTNDLSNGIIDQPQANDSNSPNLQKEESDKGSCKPFSMRKVISGPFEGGLTMDDYFPDLKGGGFYGHPGSGGTFDTGNRVGANAQLIATFPSPCKPNTFTFKQTVTYTKAKFNGVTHPKEGVVQDDIAKSGRNFNTPPERQDFLGEGYNMSMADPPSVDYKAMPEVEFDRDFVTSAEGPNGKASVNWSTSIRVVKGKVTKNTIS
jgi:hypothetical protein